MSAVGHGLLTGKSVLVTAAAGAGIGLATARRCAEEGARVVISDIHERRLAEAAEELGAHAILLPEIPFDLDKVAEKIRQRDEYGRSYSLVVVAEGAKNGAEAMLQHFSELSLFRTPAAVPASPTPGVRSQDWPAATPHAPAPNGRRLYENF